MLDLRLLREDIQKITEGLKKRGQDIKLTEILKLDEEIRRLLKEAEGFKYKRNVVSDKIGELKKKGVDAEKETLEMRNVSQRIKELDGKIKELSEDINNRLLNIPNIPHISVPVGRSSGDNVEIKKWGNPRKFNFPVESHTELGDVLGILDFQRASKITGAGFVLYKGIGARLERALINFMLNLHVKEHGYLEISPPFMVNRESATTTGNLPKFEEDLFKVDDGKYFLIPTAEVPVTNMHRDEVIPEEMLPLNYVAYTPCFRKEAGSWGQDTRGLIRQHQFDKVELVKFVKPDESYKELEILLTHAEEVLKRLELPYRVITLCTGDMGFSSAKSYDIEVWIPSQGKYREISTCSNFEDFQARRGNIRYKPKEGGKPQFLHTLNGSGLAIGRTMVAILENYQQEDGSVIIPEVLRPYMDGIEKIVKS
ncbi:MAG: serine--tRNA ligase [Nitrospinae bacterium RIFCSPLOWO2_02_39_17]|nr:MAG: serine--tRNA ligase [Nitrospinae bacterium RIFCSPLOWO2_02_39_17]